MVNYSSFLLIALLLFVTVLCVNVPSVSADTTTTTRAPNDGDRVVESVSTFFKEFAKTTGSSNALVKYMHETMNKYLEELKSDAQKVRESVTEGMEIEQQIQNITEALKNSGMELPENIQSELSEIESVVTTQLNKLKEIGDAKNVEDMKKKIQTDYDTLQSKLQSLAKLTLTVLSSKETGPVMNTKNGIKLKDEIIAFMATGIPTIFTAGKNAGSIVDKMNASHKIISKIRKSLVRVEEIKQLILPSDAAYAGTYTVSFTRSLLMQCVFAVMFGMIF